MTELPFPLIADIADARCIPFIGAGFSRNARVPDGAMPDWAGLTATLATDGGLNAGSPGPVVAQEYERRFGRVQLIEAIRRSLHPDDAQPGRSHLAFVQLPFDTIYTTNFDLLLEQSYSAAGRPFRSLVGELQLPFHAGQTATSIVKMHGDLRHEEHIVISQRDYDEFLGRYPVVATHLSAMLITRTPLFVGYSLTDPDFLSIRAVIRARLGAFERMSYVVQFDASLAEIEAALEQRVHIINVISDGRAKDEVLEGVFLAAAGKLDQRASARFRTARPDIFETVDVTVRDAPAEPKAAAAFTESTSKLCFVMMPFSERFDRVYRELIVPAVVEAGLTAIRADEISTSGFIMEQIRAAIQQSRLCIADVTDRNPNVLYELGFAQAAKKSVILIATDLTGLPFDISGLRVIRYGADVVDAREALRRAIGAELTENRFAEVEALIAAGSYRAAIAMAGVVLEHSLRELANTHDVPLRDRASIGQLAQTLTRADLLPDTVRAGIADVVVLRNAAVHATDFAATLEQARTALGLIRSVTTLAAQPRLAADGAARRS
ncbi:MAG: SIR2 family protein [Nitrospira sp.]|nr:SIR2 family protein [Nitrospira sp.]